MFAYIGFDLIATAAEDARTPRKTVPQGMLLGVGAVTVLYIAMAVVLVGMRPYSELGGAAPVSEAMAAIGANWAVDVVNLGALLALMTVILVVLIAQSRVLFNMGRDGLLPKGLGRVSRVYSSPARAAAVAGLAAVALTLYPKVLDFEELLVLGALFAFAFCAIGVLTLRRTQPNLERGFRVPLVPLIPILSLAATVWLMLNLKTDTWVRFLVWMVVGLAFYGLFGRWHSRMANETSGTSTTPTRASAACARSDPTGACPRAVPRLRWNAPEVATCAADRPVRRTGRFGCCPQAMRSRRPTRCSTTPFSSEVVDRCGPRMRSGSTARRSPRSS